MAEVTLEDVTKVYPGEVTAVDKINLNIDDNRFVVLVGPSGCGKTTTLRMVAGLEEVTQGTIRIGQRVVNDVPPKDRDIAMVFQNYALYPHMTVYKNMAFGLKLRKFPRRVIEERVRNAASLLGIEDLLDRKPGALSGGQRQRVAVGRAIVRDPACFLFDEPLSNLDAKLRVETRAELKRLHHRLQTTTIYVTHDQEEAMTLGDQVVVMSEGQIQQCGTPLTVFNNPQNRFVAGFVGTPSMNFLDGSIVVTDEVVHFEGDGVNLPLADRHAQAARNQSNPHVVLGIRPESLTLRSNTGSDHTDSDNRAPNIEVVVNLVEPLGSTMDLYCATANQHRIVARVNAEPLAPETHAKLFLDREKIHLFAPGEYGANLLV